jgi:hypothetical protein
MKKTISILAILFAFTLCFSLVSYAQTSEPPLTSSDIALYKSIIKNTVDAGEDEQKLQSVYNDAAKSNNSTENHAIYVFSKVKLIQAILDDPESKDTLIGTLPENLKPTDEEIKFVDEHQSEFF